MNGGINGRVEPQTEKVFPRQQNCEDGRGRKDGRMLQRDRILGGSFNNSVLGHLWQQWFCMLYWRDFDVEIQMATARRKDDTASHHTYCFAWFGNSFQ